MRSDCPLEVENCVGCGTMCFCGFQLSQFSHQHAQSNVELLNLCIIVLLWGGPEKQNMMVGNLAKLTLNCLNWTSSAWLSLRFSPHCSSAAAEPHLPAGSCGPGQPGGAAGRSRNLYVQVHREAVQPDRLLFQHNDRWEFTWLWSWWIYDRVYGRRQREVSFS